MQDNVGTIVIGTKVDNRGLQRDLKQTEKIMQDASEQVFKDFGEGNFDIEFNKKNIDKEINKTRNFINKKFQETQFIDFIDLKFPELKDRNIKPITDINEENYKQIIKEEKAKQRIVSLEEKISSGKGRATQIQEEIDKLREEGAELAKNYELWLELENRVQNGGALEPHEIPFYETYMDADEKITKIEEKAIDLEKKHSDINEKVRQYTNDLKVAEIEFSNINKISQQQEKAMLKSDGAFAKINESANKVGKTFSGMLKKVGKIAMALLGVRSLINLITRSFNTLTQYNTELGTKMEQMRLVLAVAFEPVINWLVNMLHVVLSLINQIYSALFSIDLFGRASELWTKKMSENMASGASSAKEMKKQLAGFDEMNVLTEPNASSAGGGGGSGTQEWTLKPKLDLDLDAILQLISDTFDKIINFINQSIENFDPKEFAKSISKIIVTLLDLINRTFTDINWGDLVSKLIQTILHLDWASILGELLENIIVTSFIFPIELLLGIIDGIVSTVLDFIENPEQFEGAGDKILTSLVSGIEKALSKLWELLKSIVIKSLKIFGIDASGAESMTFKEAGQNIMKGLTAGIKLLKDKVIEIFTNIVNTIKQKFTDFKNTTKNMIDTGINWIKQKIEMLRSFINGFIDGFKLGIQTITQWFKDKIQDIYNFFNSIITGIKTIVGNVVQWIKDKFNTFVNFFKGIGIAIGDFFSSAIKGAVNGVLSWVESKVNWFIDKINSVIFLINKIPGVSIGRLSRISLPRLATGGIINQPGRGVPVGGAIAAESGREGILPLTDHRAMQELGKEIGKWISIQATVPVNIGNRQVARVIQELNNDREFAMNS